MKTLVVTAPKTTAYRDVPDPTPGPGDVLLRVRVLGLCGSDLSTYRAANPLVTLPRVPGHEVGAVIEAVGAAVPPQLQPGMEVTISPYTHCGQCSACRRDRTNCCRNNQTLGVQRDGALAPWLVVPHEKVIVATGLSLQELALVEPLSIGFHAVARGRVSSEDTVVVFGCGMIGLGAVAGAVRAGARVIAVDIDRNKLDVALAAGATEAIDSSRSNLPERLAELTDGEGPDVCIEAVGATATYQQAVSAVAFAGRVVTIGYAKEPIAFETKLFVQRELDILGSRNAFPTDLSAAAAHLTAGAFPVERVITHTVPFHEAGEALALWDRDPAAVIKIHVYLDDA